MQQKIANGIPHDVRVQMLDEWIPNAKASLACPEFKNLWEAYFIFIDPDAVKKENCPICLMNVKNNWKSMVPFLQEAEREFLLLEKLYAGN